MTTFRGNRPAITQFSFPYYAGAGSWEYFQTGHYARHFWNADSQLWTEPYPLNHWNDSQVILVAYLHAIWRKAAESYVPVTPFSGAGSGTSFVEVPRARPA